MYILPVYLSDDFQCDSTDSYLKSKRERERERERERVSYNDRGYELLLYYTYGIKEVLVTPNWLYLRWKSLLYIQYCYWDLECHSRSKSRDRCFL